MNQAGNLFLTAIIDFCRFGMRVRSQTFAKKNDSNAYFSEFLGANGRKIDLDHEIGVQMGVKRLFKPEFVIFICLLVRLNLTFG